MHVDIALHYSYFNVGYKASAHPPNSAISYVPTEACARCSMLRRAIGLKLNVRIKGRAEDAPGKILAASASWMHVCSPGVACQARFATQAISGEMGREWTCLRVRTA